MCTLRGVEHIYCRNHTFVIESRKDIDFEYHSNQNIADQAEFYLYFQACERILYFGALTHQEPFEAAV